MTMESKTQNPPWRHHFIPQFLLGQWTTGGELLRYYRDRRGDVQCEPKSPKGVCFGRDLYKTDGFPPEHAQQMEMIFMQWIDNAAANVHARLLQGEIDALSDQECTAWARFIMSLIFRTPLDIRGLREAVTILAERARPLMEADGEGEELPPVAVEDLQMKILRYAIDDHERGSTLINMHWRVVRTSNPRELWISDWPLDVSSKVAWLGNPSSYIGLPIAPNAWFVAAGTKSLADGLVARPQREIILAQNRATVGHAQNFVGARTPNAAEFIKANFGGLPRFSVTQSMAEKYRAIDQGAHELESGA